MKNFGKQSLKTSSKKPHGHDYALSPTKAPDFNKYLDNQTITNEKQNLKMKKERKRVFKDQIKLEGEPSTSEDTISNSADIHVPTVNKIKEILSHHYSESNGKAPDIATLVKNVQKLIFSGIKDDSEPKDALAENVAKVLLESTNLSSQPMAPSPNSLKQETILERQPDLQSSNTESQNEIDDSRNEQRQTRRRIKRKRKINKEHIKQAHSKDDTSHSSKKKRKAAIKAIEKLDSIDSEIVNNNDDDDWTLEDNNSILFLKLKKEKNKSVTKNLGMENEQNSIVNNIIDGETLEKSKETIIEGINQKSPPRKEHSNTEISILVSDDDDDVIINTETVHNKETQKECTEINDKDKDLDEEERVPLHSSLLKNPNFIKIVAHTYMSGNDLLEENAAFLAAQYSTQNALREMEAGKEIYSGPLYDIAIKIVGKEILKQLQTTVKSDNVSVSPKKSIDQSPNNKATRSQMNAATVKSSKRDEECKADKNTSKRTQESQNSSDSDDLVLVESKIDEPKCSPAKKTREENSRKDSTLTAKGSNERVIKVFVPINKKNKTTSNATLPKAPSASTNKAPNLVNKGRRGSHASSSSVVDDDDDVRVVDEPAETNKPLPTYGAPNLRRRNSQSLAINCVTGAERPKEIPPFESSQTPGSKKKQPAVRAQVEPSLIIPDIDLDDESSGSMDCAEKNSTNSPPVIKSSQTNTSPKTQTIKSQLVEEQYIIPDIDLDENSTENTELTEAVPIKNSTIKPTTAVKNLKVNQGLIDAKAKSLVTAQAVETPVITDIDLDDSSNENTEQTCPKAKTSVKTQFVESSFIIPDIILHDDSPEQSETEPAKIKNTPMVSSTMAKTDKHAADLKTKATVGRVQSPGALLIIPDVDLDDDCTEQRECTETETKISQTAKTIVTKRAMRSPVSSIIEPQLIIPDICLDDSNEHSGEAESNITTNLSTESSQIITNPAISPVVTKKNVEQPLYIPDDLNEDSTGLTEQIEVSTEPTKKASGSDTICLDSDDEEAVIINEKAIQNVQENESPPAMPAVSAANICHTQTTFASTQNPGPSLNQMEPNHTSDVLVNSKNKHLDAKSETTETRTCVLDDDISVIEHVDVTGIMQSKAKIASNVLKRPHKIGEVLRFPKKIGLSLRNISPKVGSESDKKSFKIVKVYASNASDEEREKKKAEIKSDNDPLRILKDVVHIKADNFDNVKSPQTKPATGNAVSSQSNSTAESSSLKQKQVKTYGTCPKVNIKPNILMKTVMPSSSIDLTNVDAGPSKDYPKKIVPTVSNKNAKGEKRLMFQRITTNTRPIAVVGSAKDIVIGRKVEKTPSKLATIDSAFKSTKKIALKFDNMLSSNSKKRTMTSSETGPANKTKPLSYKHLTLKDFNIDDFDDIIELE